MRASKRSRSLTRKPEYELILAEYGGMVWRIAGSYEVNPETRRDLYQDILVAVWRALPKFRSEANVKTYIARIAHNRSITHVSREANRSETTELDPEIPSSGASPEQVTVENDKLLRLQRAIRELPIDQRQPITLTLEGFKPAEIAAVLGGSVNSVSIRLTRAKKRLRIMLEEENER